MVGTRRSAEPVCPGSPPRKRKTAPEEPATETKKPKTPPLNLYPISVAKANPRFHPRPVPKKSSVNVPLVDGKVPKGASILIIQRPWIDLILDGHKTLEIRGKACESKIGQRIYLALSGGGGIVIGSAKFNACHSIPTRAEWAKRADNHCVAGEALPYGANTHAWELIKPERFKAHRADAMKRGNL